MEIESNICQNTYNANIDYIGWNLISTFTNKIYALSNILFDFSYMN